MQSIQRDIEELKRLLEKKSIQTAYRALISYMLDLRTHFASKYGDAAVSGLYQGYMDMTYFAIFPPFLKECNLKVAIVFNYDTFRFEAWLSARNRKIQREYWEIFKGSQWSEYRVVAPAGGIDSIIECDLDKNFDLDRPEALTSKIEDATTVFIDHIERFISDHKQVGI